MTESQRAFEAFVDSPCNKCSMLASLHAHAPEDGEKFTFGCEGEDLEACRHAHREHLRGPKGHPGLAGEV